MNPDLPASSTPQTGMTISGLSVKITLPIVFIAALAIGLTSFLNLGKFERTLTELESSRIRFVLNDLKANLETGLGLGLPLNSLANAQAALEFEIQKDPDIVSISVYDETGLTVFHAGRPLANSAVPKSWRPAPNAKGERNWQLVENDAFVIGTGLFGVIGSDAGGMALRYSKNAHDGIVNSVAGALKFAAIVAICTTALLAIFGINLLVRRTNRKLNHIESELARGSIDQADRTGGKDDAGAAELVDGVINSSRVAMQDVAAAEQSLRAALAAGQTGARQ